MGWSSHSAMMTMECMSPTTCPHPADRPQDGASNRARPRAVPCLDVGLVAPAPFALPRFRHPMPEPSIPDSALGALSQQGYTIGEVMGRSTLPVLLVVDWMRRGTMW